MTRAAAVGAAVFALAALFYMELRQAAMLAALSGAMAFILEKARR
ncbi:MAG: hypothetical protein ACOZEN_01625 [Thermodesulfobacteriota bacterium]